MLGIYLFILFKIKKSHGIGHFILFYLFILFSFILLYIVRSLTLLLGFIFYFFSFLLFYKRIGATHELSLRHVQSNKVNKIFLERTIKGK